MMTRKYTRFAICILLFAGILAGSADGQDKNNFPPIGGLRGFTGQSQEETEVKISSRVLLDATKQKGVLQIVAVVPKGWHIYSVTQKPGGPTRTEFEFVSNGKFEFTGPFAPDKEPHKAKSEFFDVIEESHEGQVVWTAPIALAAGVDPQAFEIQGEVKGQICAESRCVLLDGMDTTFAAKVDTTTVYDPSQLGTGAAGAATSGTDKSGAAPFSLALLLKNMGYGIIGGLILNLMPCVLPVIGLKLMSFVEQSQGSRLQAFKLNLIYTLGILSVFLVLATLAVRLNLGWGEQFTNTPFKVGMAVFVFAMALSFMGIWEIPIPGFVGRGKSQELASKEGASGAFFKGIFTTILATPCSGPFLGPVFAYTAKQAPPVTYAIMLSVGLGMSLPYLLIGAFPSLMRWIPKPGAWMDTFKQFMGFVLLATTVYLVSLVDESLFVPTLALMFGVWFGCWWIGRVPLTASFDRKLASWIGGVAVSAAVGFVAFNYLGGHLYLNWSPYSENALVSAKQEGKTVLVDFTASWCPTCQLNTYRAIDTKRVSEAVEQLGVLPMLADWSDKSEEIKQKLAELDSVSIPLLAIYPANAPDNPIILRDLVSEQQVLEALQQAGPSFEANTVSGSAIEIDDRRTVSTRP